MVKLSIGERKEMKTMEGKGEYKVWYYVVRKRDEVKGGRETMRIGLTGRSSETWGELRMG